jgi:hypothetical protein
MQKIQRYLEHIDMKNIDISDIDRFHDDWHIKLDPDTISNIYSKILGDPLRYLLANSYFARCILYSAFPFILLLLFFKYFMIHINPGVYFEIIIVLSLLWIWFNRYTCYVLIKLLMISYSIFPFLNIFYHLSGKLIHIRFLQYNLAIVLTAASIQIIYQLIFNLNF